jgi:hypothetical protein
MLFSLQPSHRGKHRKLLTGRLATAMIAATLASGSVATVHAQGAGPTITVGTTSPASDAVTLADVKIVYPGEKGTTITIDEIVLTGMNSSGDRFTADEVKIKGLKTSYTMGAAIKLTIDTASLDNVSGPVPSEDKLSAAGTPGDIPPLADWLLAAKAETISIPAIGLTTEMGGTRTETSYRSVELNNVDAGKVGSIVIAATDQSSSGATPSANLKAKLGKMQIEEVDFGAYAAWLDDTLAAAAPKEKRLVYKSFSLEGFSTSGGEGPAVSVEGLSGSGVKIGPPSMKPSELMTLIGRMQADPKFGEKSPGEMIRFVRGILGAFEIGEFELSGLKVAEPGKPPFAVGLVRFENFAGTKIGEVRLGDISVTDEKEGTEFKLGSFAIRGFDVAEIDSLLDTVARGESPDKLAPSQFPKPRITGLALADIDMTVPGKGRFTVGAITLDTPDWVGFSPVTLKARVEGFSMPVDAIEEPASREQFKALGLSSLTINTSVDASWKEADETMAIGPLSVDLDGIGKVEISGEIGGVPKNVFENPQIAEQAIATLDFRGLSLSLEDGGAFAKLLDMAAKEQGTTRESLANQTSMQVQGAMIAFLGMEDAAKKMSTAIKTFISSPQSLQIAIKTLEPIPAIAFMQVGSGDQNALSLIKKSIEVDAMANQ